MENVLRYISITLNKAWDIRAHLLPVTILHTILTLSALFLLWNWPLLLTAVFMLLAMIELLAIGKKSVFFIGIFCSVGFGLSELLCIQLGAWSYAVTSFLDMPLWVFPGYGNITISAIALYELSSRYGLEK